MRQRKRPTNKSTGVKRRRKPRLIPDDEDTVFDQPDPMDVPIYPGNPENSSHPQEKTMSPIAKRGLQLLGVVILVLALGLWVRNAGAAEARMQPIDTPTLNVLIDQTNFAVGNPTFCSATLIHAERRLLLTANHCIRDQFETIEREKVGLDGTVKTDRVRIAKPGLVSQLSFKDGDVVVRTDYTFKIIQNDADMDLALIEVKGILPNSTKAEIACRDLVRGDTVFAVGNPYGRLYASLTKGIVSSTERSTRLLGIPQSTDTQFTQFSAPIIGGNSGGALLNEQGELVGVNVRGGATGFGFATPLSDIKKLLSREMLTDLWKRCK